MLPKFITAIIILTPSLFFAQRSADFILLKADSLFQNQNYFDAITEYKRFLFFEEKNKEYYCSNQVGLCYKAGAWFDESIKYFSLANRAAANDEEKYQAQLNIIRANILRKTTVRALELCEELESGYNTKEKLDEINYWKGWTYIFSDEWENASVCFGKISASHALKMLSDEVEKEKVSVTFATVISYILPGSGQIYSGEILSGLMSFAWNVFAGYLTINSFLQQRAFDGIVTAELLWLRFYRGNIQNAREFAIQKNLEISNRNLRFLQTEFKGLKP